jgi:hypothetical protein
MTYPYIVRENYIILLLFFLAAHNIIILLRRTHLKIGNNVIFSCPDLIYASL